MDPDGLISGTQGGNLGGLEGFLDGGCDGRIQERLHSRIGKQRVHELFGALAGDGLLGAGGLQIELFQEVGGIVDGLWVWTWNWL